MDDNRRTVAEAYQSAANTSDLKVVADRRGDADTIIAAGMSPSRMGLLLLRLVSEWDGAARPPQRDPASTALWLGRLKSLPAARDELRAVAAKNRLVVDADVVLLHWLHSACQSCHGRRWQRIKDTPALSGKPCPSCRGSGERALPGGENGKKLAIYIEDCLSRARDSIKKRLRSDRNG